MLRARRCSRQLSYNRIVGSISAWLVWIALLVSLGCGPGHSPKNAVILPAGSQLQVGSVLLSPAVNLQAGNALPTPPFTSPDPAVIRATSAGSTLFSSTDVVASDGKGATGALPGGMMAIRPGGEDDLAWAIFRVPMNPLERPSQLNLSILKAIRPGGEDDLVVRYTIGVYNFSVGHWEWIYKNGANSTDWNDLGDVQLVLNSPSRRARYCNLNDGSSVSMYFAVVVPSPASVENVKCGVCVAPGTLDHKATTDGSYFETAPLQARISGAAVDPHTGHVTLGLIPPVSDGAERVYLERRLTGNNAWVQLGSFQHSGIRSLEFT